MARNLKTFLVKHVRSREPARHRCKYRRQIGGRGECTADAQALRPAMKFVDPEIGDPSKWAAGSASGAGNFWPLMSTSAERSNRADMAFIDAEAGGPTCGRNLSDSRPPFVRARIVA